MAKQNSAGAVFTSLIFLAITFGFIRCMVCDGSDGEPSKPKPKHDSIGAWVMCEAFVKDRLKSPSTASFGGIFDGDYQDPNKHTKYLGNGRYQCFGFVDSQNSFGATVRSNFQLTVQHRGGDKWRLAEGPVIQ